MLMYNQIHFEGAQHYLGTYETPEEAAKAYDQAAREHHGMCVRLTSRRGLCVHVPIEITVFAALHTCVFRMDLLDLWMFFADT